MATKIKGLRVPEACINCPFALLNSWGERQCYVTDADVTDLIHDRHDECPMDEVDD